MNRQAPLELCHKNPTSWKGCETGSHYPVNCGEVHTHASYKTTRTWENFNKYETKMILVSDELCQSHNNSQSFANGSKSMIRNNVVLCHHAEIYRI